MSKSSYNDIRFSTRTFIPVITKNKVQELLDHLLSGNVLLKEDNEYRERVHVLKRDVLINIPVTNAELNDIKRGDMCICVIDHCTNKVWHDLMLTVTCNYSSGTVKVPNCGTPYVPVKLTYLISEADEIIQDMKF